jgi:uroporphyrinogen decarboxylase
MRQAGRYLPQYRETRKSYGVLEAAKTPAVSEAITLLPVNELGVDAAVLFADIMLPLEGMGIDFRIEENLGPVIDNPVRELADVEKLRDFVPKAHVPYVLETIQRVRAKLDRSGHALVGFSGAPFTIASYLIEGQPSRDFAKTKRLMLDDRDAWILLMSMLTEMTAKYLAAQIDAGVDAIQLFDSWVGCLSTSDYDEFVAPFTKKIFERLDKDYPSVPRIHFGTNTFHLLQSMKHDGGNVFSIDWRASIRDARRILGERAAIQGNLEPAVLLARDKSLIAARTQRVLDENDGRDGHVFNLGHGILRDTPVENAKYVVDYVHSKSH